MNTEADVSGCTQIFSSRLCWLFQSVVKVSFKKCAAENRSVQAVTRT